MADGGKLQRMNPLTLVVAAAIGATLGLLIELALSSRGRPPLVPPYSMSVTLVALAALLIVLALRLRRNLAKGVGAVNPFHAVRLLATARAGQLVGALFAGFGGGMLLSLAWRSVPAPAPTWAPMLVTAAAGAVLLVCAIIAEHLCRVPPSEHGEGDAAASGEEGVRGAPALGYSEQR